MFVLDKMSMPGWEFKTNHIEKIFWLLDQSVCSICKMTKAEYEKSDLQVDADYLDEEDEGINPYTFSEFNPYTFSEFKPETYDQWSMLERVEWLMGTACGCEFDFYDEADGSDLTFVEIKS